VFRTVLTTKKIGSLYRINRFVVVGEKKGVSCDVRIVLIYYLEEGNKKKCQGLMLGFACSVPDCWLEVSLHPECPATDQLDQGFSVVFLGHRANAGLVPKFHVALYASHAALPMVISKFSSNAAR
jgi:hypothetical protein